MIKKIVAMILCLTMLLSLPAMGAVFTDVPNDGSERAVAVGVLSELGIISGMGDGTFSPYSHLTRAQAAKIAVCIMGKTKEAVVTTDAFSDVKSTHWYSGYVNVVAKEDIITGYPDGSFGAEDTLTYAQAITIIVRLLGYGASDVGYKWPQGYLDKAQVLNLTEGMVFEPNAAITREAAAVIIYRALFNDMKGTKTKLVTKMGKNVYEDAIVLATSRTNASLLVNEVQTDKGVFTFDSVAVDMEGSVGKEGTLVVNDENAVIAFVENPGFLVEEYTVSAVYADNNDKVSVVTENGSEVYLSAKTKLYMGGSEYTAQKLSEGVNAGSSMSVFKENGSIKYVFVEEYRNIGPVTVLEVAKAKDIFSLTDKNSTRVIRKGISASWEDIEMYDVLYYSEKTNTVYAYCDRVTGLYEKAYPMKANVSTVTVSGKEYALSSMTAVNKLNEKEGAFALGDRVTLLFGEDGTVVDAVSLTYRDFSMYGVVTGSGKEISSDKETSGRTEFYIDIMHADGNTVRYVVENDDYSDKAGELCSVDFEDSYAKLTFVKESAVAGFVNITSMHLGTEKLSDEVKILECVEKTAGTAKVRSVKLLELEGSRIEKKDVKSVVYNPKGEIEVLYLDNVTGSSSIFGIIVDREVTKDNSGNSSGTYTILSGNETYILSGVYYPALQRGDCVEYINSANKRMAVELSSIATGHEIENVIDNVIVLDGESYTLADDAVFYAGKSSEDLRTVSKEDLKSLTGNAALFSDRTVFNGGKVRVVRIYTAK